MNPRIFFTCWALILATTGWAWAGDAAELRFIGFSSDGKSLAFEQYGVSDGRGASYSEYFFVDVARNVYAAPPKRGETDNTDLSTLRARQRVQVLPILRELNLEPAQLGNLVVANPLPERTTDPLSAEFSLQSPEGGVAQGDYQLQLSATPTEQTCGVLGVAQRLTVALNNLHNGKRTVLQQDNALPAGRGCATRYRIYQAYTYKDHYFVAFINIFSPGFEGENMRFMAVSGILPK